MGWLDKTLMRFAPGMAAQRMRAQLSAKYYERQLRSYAAASSGRRTAHWKATGTSANADSASAGVKLRNKARDLEKNNGWGARVIQVIDNNVVGTGIRARLKYRDASKAGKAKVKKATSVWNAWAETTACDFDGVNDLYGIQSLVDQTVIRDGEVLVIFRRVAIMKLPLQLQVLEIDHLDTTRQSADNGNRILQGVEVDSQGRPVAYWIYPEHPGDATSWISSLRRQSIRIKAEEVAHVFYKKRPGQLRAVTWLAPIILPLADLDDYEDAQLMKQKVSACYAAFVTDPNGAGEEVPNANGEPLAENLEPGMIEYLPPGRSVEFGDPPKVDGYPEFVRAVLRKVAAGMGVTYEALTGDLTQVNFSGGRMGWLEMNRNIEAWRWRMMIPQFCMRVWDQFTIAATLAGHDLDGISAEWTPPRRELINPKDEVLAEQMQVRNGFKSWSESVREAGYDPDVVLEEIIAERAKFKAAGLVLDSDPTTTTAQGQAQQDDAEAAKPAAE